MTQTSALWLRFRCWWNDICFVHAIPKDTSWGVPALCKQCDVERYNRTDSKTTSLIEELKRNKKQ